MDVPKKRSAQIRLILMSGLVSGALSGCGSKDEHGLPPSAKVYPNDHHVNALGYYHAPFRAWYSRPYNYFEPTTSLYYQGGQWATQPYRSVINLSEPNEDALRALERATGHVTRGGFGSSSHGRSFFS